MTELIRTHIARYPAAQEIDVIKLVFQSMLGCGHLLPAYDNALDRLTEEMDSCTADVSEPLYERIGNDYCRLNLRRCKAQGIPAKWIARMMLMSDEPTYGRVDVVKACREIDFDALGLSQTASDDWILRLEDEAFLPSHSEAFRAAYAPAYRVISSRLLFALPALCDLARLQGQRRLIAMDGCCASGKTTLASMLHEITGAAVIHMDDFFIPHAQKTPERLAIPGGNADITRFRSEVILPYCSRQMIRFRPYSCCNHHPVRPVCDCGGLLLSASHAGRYL
ncbi:MAG: hypothetical protein Q4C54_09465 [Clostridia bacterium]|nr:hypothetical protein [Clostridia bacterium]